MSNDGSLLAKVECRLRRDVRTVSNCGSVKTADSLKTFSLKAIAAMASNRVIGRDGHLPWRLPEDLKWFKKLTMGSPVIMGRRTAESIGRPLPGRRNLVLSRSPENVSEGLEWVKDPDDLEKTLEGEQTAWLIGGAQLYASMLRDCDELYLSYIFEPHEGNAFFPPFEERFELAEVLDRTRDFELRRYVRK